MDNLCHTLVGAALAECGLRRRTRYATAALVLGANLPDIDILAVFTEHGLGFRRGITHGVLALVVLPFVLTGILLLWDRLFPTGSRRTAHGSPPARPRALLGLSALAIVTHPTLDWMNVYGMRWLMPFNGRWFSADALFIVDPWLLLILGAAWIVGASYRRTVESADGLIVPSSHRHTDSSSHRIPSRGELFARGMVALGTVYILVMMGITAFGRRVAVRDLGLTATTRRDVMVGPPFLDSWKREVVARVDGVYRFGRIDWRPVPRLIVYSKVLEPSMELVDGLPRTVPLNDLLDWARFPYARMEGNVVHADDARYARAGRSFAGVDVPVSREP